MNEKLVGPQKKKIKSIPTALTLKGLTDSGNPSLRPILAIDEGDKLMKYKEDAEFTNLTDAIKGILVAAEINRDNQFLIPNDLLSKLIDQIFEGPLLLASREVIHQTISPFSFFEQKDADGSRLVLGDLEDCVNKGGSQLTVNELIKSGFSQIPGFTPPERELSEPYMVFSIAKIIEWLLYSPSMIHYPTTYAQSGKRDKENFILKHYGEDVANVLAAATAEDVDMRTHTLEQFKNVLHAALSANSDDNS